MGLWGLSTWKSLVTLTRVVLIEAEAEADCKGFRRIRGENLESVTVDRAVKEGREMRQWFEDEKGQKAFVCVCVFHYFLLEFYFFIEVSFTYIILVSVYITLIQYLCIL